MVKYTEAMVGSEISSEIFQNFVNSNLYGTSYTVNIRASNADFMSACLEIFIQSLAA